MELEVYKKIRVELSKYEKHVLPKLLSAYGISPESFCQTVLNEIKKNEKILQAYQENPASVYAAVLAGAEIGLVPNELGGEFYLIPRAIKQKNGKYLMTACPQIGYKGLVRLLLRGGEYVRVHAEVVYAGDEFEPVFGLEPNIIHKPNFAASRTAADITHAYAVAKSKNGEYSFFVMSRAEIVAIQNMAKEPNSLYFNDKKNPMRWMERKAPLVQLAKTLIKDTHIQHAIGQDGAVEAGAFLTLDEHDKPMLVEDTMVRPTRMRNIYGTLNKSAEEQQEENQ